MNEVSYEITVRTGAPLGAVWDELCTLDRLLGHVPGISSVELNADGTSGSFTFVLSRLGRVWRRLEITAALTGVTPPRQPRWRLETPSLEWEFDGSFEPTPAGAEETTLVYRGTMRFSDRYAGPLQPIHAEVLEEHLETLIKAFGPPAVLAAELADVDGVNEAFLFGSWAARYHDQEGARAVGDIDLLVLGEPGRDALYKAVARASTWLGREVQVIIRKPGWLNSGTGTFHDAVVSRPTVAVPLRYTPAQR